MTVNVSASASSAHAGPEHTGARSPWSAARARSVSWGADAGYHAPATRTTRSSREARCALATGRGWPVAHAAEEELPLVVMRARTLVQPKRGFLALAANPHESTTGLSAGEWRLGLSGKWRRGWGLTRSHSAWRLRISGRRRAQSGGWSAAAAAARLLLLRRAALSRHAGACQDQIPFAALRHRILVRRCWGGNYRPPSCACRG
jgi:hypothetical protein